MADGFVHDGEKVIWKIVMCDGFSCFLHPLELLEIAAASPTYPNVQVEG